MNCYRYNSNSQPHCGDEGTHYVKVIFQVDGETDYNNDCTCQGHISAFIEEHKYLTILEIKAERLER